MIKKLAIVLSMFFCSLVSAQNIGFEAGNLSSWTSSGADATISTGLINASYGGGLTWTIRPYGSYMAQLYPSGSTTFDSTTASLGLASVDNTAIKNFMAANAGGGDPTPTNASWIRRTVTLQAGTTYTFAWNYLSTDYTPYNDGSMITLVHSTDITKIPTLNNEQKRYALLGFTNPGTGNYSTDSYGSTGWQMAVFTVPESGNYIMGFASFNLGDTALSPMLFIDEVQGITELNGQPFSPIAPNPGSSAPVTGGGSTEPTYVSDITAAQTTIMNSALARRNAIGSNNRIDLYSDGSGNVVNIEQSGGRNRVQGLGGGNAHVAGFGAAVAIRQGDYAATPNLIELYAQGNGNNITIDQARNTATGARDGAESGGHVASVSVTGDVNSVLLRQGNSGGVSSGHYANIVITGSGNEGTIKQSDNNSKIVFVNVSGNHDVFLVNQLGTGQHFLDLTLIGNGNSASITQNGSAAHKATISLSNAGGPSSATLIQQGSTAQIYSITQQCANLAGCSVSVTQGQ